MQVIETIPQVEGKRSVQWQTYLVDSLIAICGTLLITGIFYALRLYPAIPNISIVYLLLILLLAGLRGRYPAILAAVIAVLSFDFFLVPPLYTFTMARGEEWVALIVFLIIALVTSQLAATTRQNVEIERRRARATSILYELLRIANSHEHLDDLLQVVALAIVRVFSTWGVRASALLLLDERGTLAVRADAPLRIETFALSAAEMEAAMNVMKSGRILDQRNADTSQESMAEPFLRLLPLKTGDEVLGVLALRISDPVPWFANEKRLVEEQQKPDSPINFFWTFLEQATSIIERARLREQLSTSNH